MHEDDPLPELESLRDASPPDSVAQRIATGAATRAPRRPRWPLALGAALAAGLLFLAVRPVSAPPPQPASVAARPPTPTATPAPRERVVEAGPHRITAADDAIVKVDTPAEGRTEITLDGRARFDVEPLTGGGVFRVRTAHVLVEVVGTSFAVDATPDCTTVSVSEGRVRVTHGRVFVLTAGDRRRLCGAAPTPPDGEYAGLRDALALIAEGRDLDGAAARLERYAARRPDGALLEEALFHLALVRARQGQRDAAVDAGHRFLRRFPQSRRAERLRRELPELGGP